MKKHLLSIALSLLFVGSLFAQQKHVCRIPTKLNKVKTVKQEAPEYSGYVWCCERAVQPEVKTRVIKCTKGKETIVDVTEVTKTTEVYQRANEQAQAIQTPRGSNPFANSGSSKPVKCKLIDPEPKQVDNRPVVIRCGLSRMIQDIPNTDQVSEQELAVKTCCSSPSFNGTYGTYQQPIAGLPITGKCQKCGCTMHPDHNESNFETVTRNTDITIPITESVQQPIVISICGESTVSYRPVYKNIGQDVLAIRDGEIVDRMDEPYNGPANIQRISELNPINNETVDILTNKMSETPDQIQHSQEDISKLSFSCWAGPIPASREQLKGEEVEGKATGNQRVDVGDNVPVYVCSCRCHEKEVEETVTEITIEEEVIAEEIPAQETEDSEIISVFNFNPVNQSVEEKLVINEDNTIEEVVELIEEPQVLEGIVEVTEDVATKCIECKVIGDLAPIVITELVQVKIEEVEEVEVTEEKVEEEQLVNPFVQPSVPASQGNMLLYPNPGISFVNLKWNGVKDLAMVQVFDLTGKLVREITTHSNKVRIDRDELTMGMYVVRAFDSNNDILKVDRFTFQ